MHKVPGCELRDWVVCRDAVLIKNDKADCCNLERFFEPRASEEPSSSSAAPPPTPRKRRFEYDAVSRTFVKIDPQPNLVQHSPQRQQVCVIM